MTTVTLNNGVAMPQPGLGVFRLKDLELAQEVVLAALKNGYRHIDTAQGYENEEAVGAAVRSSGIPREEIFVTSKLRNAVQREDGDILESFEGTLRRLDIGYVDLFLVHWPIPGKVESTWRGMEEIYKTGKAKAIGVSNHRIEDLELIRSLGGTMPAVNQVELHPYFHQRDLMAYCSQHGIHLQGWAPLGGDTAPLLEDVVLREIAAKHGKSPAQVALRWALQYGITPLPKSQNPVRQLENLSLFDFILDEDDMHKIAALDTNQRRGGDPNNVTW